MIPWVSLALGIAVQGPVQATLAGRGQGVLFWGVGTQAKCAAVLLLAAWPLGLAPCCLLAVQLFELLAVLFTIQIRKLLTAG